MIYFMLLLNKILEAVPVQILDSQVSCNVEDNYFNL